MARKFSETPTKSTGSSVQAPTALVPSRGAEIICSKHHCPSTRTSIVGVSHRGTSSVITGSAGRFREPPFAEVAVGCENCHGPGSKHLTVIRTNFSAQNARNSIVNPAKLTPWLVDNICMRCHQSGQARVLQPGKDYSDFRPGAA